MLQKKSQVSRTYRVIFENSNRFEFELFFARFESLRIRVNFPSIRIDSNLKYLSVEFESIRIRNIFPLNSNQFESVIFSNFTKKISNFLRYFEKPSSNSGQIGCNFNRYRSQMDFGSPGRSRKESAWNCCRRILR